MITQYDLPRNFYRSRSLHVMRRQDVIDFLGELTQTANTKTRCARSRSCTSQFGTVGGAVTGAVVARPRLASIIFETYYGKQ